MAVPELHQLSGETTVDRHSPAAVNNGKLSHRLQPDYDGMITGNQLILCPRKIDQTVKDVNEFLAMLERIGFIDGALAARKDSYRPGEEFLQLLTFLGCSPVVSLGEPGATGDEFCFVEISEFQETPQFLGGSNVKQPRCPTCGHRLEQWTEAVAAWTRSQPDYTWQCPACSANHELPGLKWRQCAGFGRFFLRIWGVFEGEAVPSETLMNHLEQSTRSPWTYFYYRA